LNEKGHSDFGANFVKYLIEVTTNDSSRNGERSDVYDVIDP